MRLQVTITSFEKTAAVRWNKPACGSARCEKSDKLKRMGRNKKKRRKVVSEKLKGGGVLFVITRCVKVRGETMSCCGVS